MSLSEINTHLYVGPIRAVTRDELERLGITCIVNVCTMNLNRIRSDQIRYVHVPLEDTDSELIYVHFDRISDTINSVFEQGGKTAVCCVAGISRSTSFCIAYLMKYHHMTLRNAFLLMRQKRRVVRPNNGFFEQLIRYEERLFGQPTVRMIAVGDSSEQCLIPDIFKETCKGFIWLKSYKNLLKKKKT